MSAHRARHGASSGGRSVSEILAQMTASPGGTATLAPTRSAFTVAAAAAVGAGAAAASVTGTFPAIQAPSFGSDSVAHIVEPAASSAPAAALASAPAAGHSAARPSSVTSALSGAPRSQGYSTGAKGGTVMATDLHQADAKEIAALSRVADLTRSSSPSALTASNGSDPVGGAVEAVAGAVGSVLDAALALPSKIGGVPIVGLAGSESAATALKNAATKLGKPYVWGAVGPNAFDCSGLMQWAYKQAGINIPRTSSQQAKFGKAVSVKDLKPGDMVFYYSPVSHVGMYLGNGKILHASETGKPVKISNVNAFPIHNARRVTA
ncbi:C40 family peptidase [Pseudonocardia spinosispora]|uniref:C40 family peptidase n=1 Tax=Pseudonocardia spinosispora TaxID=103441 RepID=UPI000402165B|nr:C40 family peptidase [Pseudonocardia spinosispora]